MQSRPRELGDPRADRLVRPEPLEMLVDACEDLLENVLRVVAFEPEALRADREDVAREPLDELVPGVRRRRPCSVRRARRPLS